MTTRLDFSCQIILHMSDTVVPFGPARRPLNELLDKLFLLPQSWWNLVQIPSNYLSGFVDLKELLLKILHLTFHSYVILNLKAGVL